MVKKTVLKSLMNMLLDSLTQLPAKEKRLATLQFNAMKETMLTCYLMTLPTIVTLFSLTTDILNGKIKLQSPALTLDYRPKQVMLIASKPILPENGFTEDHTPMLINQLSDLLETELPL